MLASHVNFLSKPKVKYPNCSLPFKGCADDYQQDHQRRQSPPLNSQRLYRDVSDERSEMRARLRKKVWKGKDNLGILLEMLTGLANYLDKD